MTTPTSNTLGVRSRLASHLARDSAGSGFILTAPGLSSEESLYSIGAFIRAPLLRAVTAGSCAFSAVTANEASERTAFLQEISRR